MITTRKRYTVAIAIVLALAVTPALSSCSLVKGVIQQQSGVGLPSKDIPADFPKSDVPLIDGEVVLGASIGTGDKEVWNVTIKVTDVSAFDTIDAALKGAGYTAVDSATVKTSDGATGSWTKDKRTVLVVIAKDGDKGFIANYTVGPLNN
jgi:hypothetical protein